MRSRRLSVRPWAAADAEAFLDIYHREEVFRYLGSGPTPVRTLEQARERIALWNARTTGDTGLWAITVNDAGSAPIGTVLLVPLPRSDGEPSAVMEIGWHLHPAVWGNGYATEAATIVIDLARRSGLTTLHAVVHPDNTASSAVAKRLGMAGHGLTREWYGEELEEYVLDLSSAPL